MSCTDANCFIESKPILSAANPRTLFEQLCAVIDQCLFHGECFFIVEDDQVDRYVQGLVEASELVIESVSNASLGPECEAEHGLSTADEYHLLELGWWAPTTSTRTGTAAFLSTSTTRLRSPRRFSCGPSRRCIVRCLRI